MSIAPDYKTIPMKRLDLNETERSFFIFDFVPGISSVTFFDGAPPIDYLRQRTKKIVEANPWVAAKPSREGGVKHMVYPANAADLPDLFQVFEANDKDDDFDFRNMDISKSYGEISRAAIPMIVKKGSEITEEDKGGFLVSVVTNNKSKSFALVVSLSHIAGDGHTFYALHHMLSKEATVEALDPKRRLDFEEKQKERMGVDMAKGASGVPFTLRTMMGAIKLKLYTKKQVQQLYYVDDDYIEDQKKEFQEQRKKDDDEGEKDAEPTFVSTNDILTSWFYAHIQTQFSIMIINLRNRIKGITDNLAGNYESAIAYQHDDSRTPALIRKAVRSCGRDKTCPSLWKWMWSTPYALVTNWATLDKGIDLPGAEQRLHLPLALDDSLHADMSVCIIFKPRPGKLGLFFMSDYGISVESDASSPVGEAIGN